VTPSRFRMYYGNEACGAEVQIRAGRRGIRLMFVQPVQPTKNAYVERFNRTVRHGLPDERPFDSNDYAQQTATDRLWRYNKEWPGMTVRGIAPNQELASAA